jgi:anti-sigma factor RsiW
MDTKFLELLPWYANGTLTDADRAWVEEMLRKDPRAAAELAWHQSLQQRVQADVPEVSDEIGLARTLKRIRTEAAATQAAVAPRRAAARRGTSLSERVREFFEGMRLTPAFAMAALVIVVQAGVIFNLAGGDREYEQVRALPGAVTEGGQLFRVAFRPEASETDMRMLLVSIQGNIESGPGQLGDYYVRVPADKALEAGNSLKSSAIVDAVMTVDAVPARGH